MKHNLISLLIILMMLTSVIPVSVANIFGVQSGDEGEKDIFMDNDDHAFFDVKTGINESIKRINNWISSNGDDEKVRLIVGVYPERTKSLYELESRIDEHNADVVNTISIKEKVIAVVCEIDIYSMAVFVTDVSSMGFVSYVEPDMKVQVQLVPNDPYWNIQWGPQMIGADWAWNITVGDPSVLVAVVDTGVDYTHPDIAGNYAALGYDWAYSDGDPMDGYGHGTHCAGIIAAVMNNSIGIAGTAQVQVMAEKVLDDGGWGYADWVASGIIHATDVGADIISMSIGSYDWGELLQVAVDYAYSSGVLMVAAAGNSDTNIKLYPAGYDEIVAVAATDRYDTRASFSNWGEWIEAAAPGVDIYSTIPGGYMYADGTSMACPHVAGAAALIWSLHPNKTRDWVRMWLRTTADDLGDVGFDIYYGYGRINIRRAIETPPPAHELIVNNWETPPYVEPGSLGMINATILNFGENDETGVLVQLLVDGVVVDSDSIGFLASGNDASVSLVWSPTIIGSYNITLHVVPAPGEVNVENNVVSKIIHAGFPIKVVVLHSAGNMYSSSITCWQVLNTEWHLFGDTMLHIDYTSLNKEDITYEDITATDADVLMISCAATGYEFTDSEVEAIERYVHKGHGLIATAGTFYYGVPNNNKLAPLFGMDDTILWHTTSTDLLHLINETHPIFEGILDPLIFPMVGTSLPDDGVWDNNELVNGEYLALGHYEESAIVTYRGLVYISPWLETIPPYYHHNLQVLYNAMVWSRYVKPEHELIASLECPNFVEPGTPVLINATVYNFGLNNETDVELHLLLNDAEVANETIAHLANGTSHTINHLWTSFTEGDYNITVYVPSVPGEETTTNNIASKMVDVHYRGEIALISDHSELMAITPLLDSMDISYDIYNDNYMNYYTADLSFLVSYSNVIFNQFNRLISSSEHSALQSYLSSGGNLLVTGYDSLGSPSDVLLADVVRSSSIGDNVGESELYVVEESHPIMEGPYGSFPTGYYISGLYSDCDLAEADIARNAVTVAELGNGYDKIIATEGLPGKVVYWNGMGTEDWLWNSDCGDMFKNIIDWFIPPRKHDIAVTLDTPLYLEPGEPSMLNVTVDNRGLNNETNVELFLFIDDNLVCNITIPEFPNGTSRAISYLWTSTVEATYNITAYAPPVPNENFTANNRRTAFISVSYAVMIGSIETHGEYLNEELASYYRSLGHIVERITTTITPEVLENYEVIIATEGGSAWLSSEITATQDFISSGSGFLALGDELSTSVETILSTHGISCTGTDAYSGASNNFDPLHPIMQGVNYFYAGSPIDSLRLSSPAHWIANDALDMYTLIAGADVGGHVLCISDELDHYVYAEDNAVMFRNIIDWIKPRPCEHELTVTLNSPFHLEPGEPSMLNATVNNLGLNNETNVELYLLINGTVVSNVTSLELLTGSFYGISYLWTPTVEATYNITAYAPPVPNENFTANNRRTAFTLVSYAIANVAVLNSYDVPSYFTGGWNNYYQILVDALINNGFHAQAVTNEEIIAGILYDFDVFVMIDNVPSDAAVPYVYDFWLSQGGILAFDSSICFLCYAGILPPESSGSNGYGVYWDYGTETRAKVSMVHPVTSGYTVGQLINGQMGDAEYFFSAIANTTAYPYFAKLVEDASISDFSYVSAYEPPSGGRTVHIWDQWHWENSELQQMILNAIMWIKYYGERERNVAVRSVTALPTEVYAGEDVTINVTLSNEGRLPEEVRVRVYADNSSESHFISGFISDIPSEPHTANAMWLEPSWKDLTNYTIGQKFNITVWVNLTEASFSWQLHLMFNTSHLNVCRVGYTSGFQSAFFEGHTTIPLTPIIDIIDGYVRHGESLLGDDEKDPGYGSLCWIEFEVTDYILGYQDQLVMSPINTFFLSPYLDDIIIDLYDGAYGFGVTPPPPPPPPPPITLPLIEERILDLAAMSNTTISFTWNTTGVPLDNYTIRVEIDPLPFEENLEDNIFIDGVVEVLSMHDVSIYEISIAKPWVYEGLSTAFNITVVNNGDFTENVTVLLYYNITEEGMIGTETILNLLPFENRTITMIWDTTGLLPCRNHTITSIAEISSIDYNPSDNTLTYGKVHIRLLGDINGDNIVDMRDIGAIVIAYGSFPGHARWNPEADMNNDNKIDMRDVALTARNFGRCA